MRRGVVVQRAKTRDLFMKVQKQSAIETRHGVRDISEVDTEEYAAKRRRLKAKTSVKEPWGSAMAKAAPLADSGMLNFHGSNIVSGLASDAGSDAGGPRSSEPAAPSKAEPVPLTDATRAPSSSVDIGNPDKKKGPLEFEMLDLAMCLKLTPVEFLKRRDALQKYTKQVLAEFGEVSGHASALEKAKAKLKTDGESTLPVSTTSLLTSIKNSYDALTRATGKISVTQRSGLPALEEKSSRPHRRFFDLRVTIAEQLAALAHLSQAKTTARRQEYMSVRHKVHKNVDLLTKSRIRP